MKNKVIGALAILLAGSVLLNIGQFFGFGKGEQADPEVGTYICGNETEDATYIVLTTDHEYCRYQQYQMLEEADYTMDETGMIAVEGDENTVLIYSDRGLYFIRDGKADLYEKKSDTPTFVNVDRSTEEL